MEHQILLEALSKNNIRYLLCGGLAVNIYGIPRMTADIDLVLDFDLTNIQNFEKMMKSILYQPTNPISFSQLFEESKRIELVKEKNMIVYSFFNSRTNFMNVDVLIDVPFDFENLWKEHEIRKVGETDIHLVSVRHLIEMKEYSNRKQDHDDILHLTKFLKKQ